mgnify:CR=1 FL=1
MEILASRINGGGTVGTLYDVTAIKQSEDELRKLSLVASFTDNLVIIADREGRTEWVNQAFVQRTGYTLDEINGRADMLTPPDKLDESVRNRAAIKAGKLVALASCSSTRRSTLLPDLPNPYAISNAGGGRAAPPSAPR